MPQPPRRPYVDLTTHLGPRPMVDTHRSRIPPTFASLIALCLAHSGPAPAQQPNPRTASHDRAATEIRGSWWAFQPVHDPAEPAVGDESRSGNAIDHFVSRKLRAAGLIPAREAKRSAVVRRVFFDLVGLPPTPAEAAAFLTDKSPDAHERLIDRLLDDPRYGERQAQHWLDLVRYADSDGFKSDHFRPEAWRYRDYVVGSFNTDKPYDRFIREQLAGDEIAMDDPDVVVATGYLRHGQYEHNQRDVPKQRQDC